MNKMARKSLSKSPQKSQSSSLLFSLSVRKQLYLAIGVLVAVASIYKYKNIVLGKMSGISGNDASDSLAAITTRNEELRLLVEKLNLEIEFLESRCEKEKMVALSSNLLETASKLAQATKNLDESKSSQFEQLKRDLQLQSEIIKEYKNVLEGKIGSMHVVRRHELNAAIENMRVDRKKELESLKGIVADKVGGVDKFFWEQVSKNMEPSVKKYVGKIEAERKQEIQSIKAPAVEIQKKDVKGVKSKKKRAYVPVDYPDMQEPVVEKSEQEKAADAEFEAFKEMKGVE